MTGWRISEPLALTRDDVDLESGTAITYHGFSPARPMIRSSCVRRLTLESRKRLIMYTDPGSASSNCSSRKGCNSANNGIIRPCACSWVNQVGSYLRDNTKNDPHVACPVGESGWTALRGALAIQPDSPLSKHRGVLGVDSFVVAINLIHRPGKQDGGLSDLCRSTSEECQSRVNSHLPLALRPNSRKIFCNPSSNCRNVSGETG